MQKTFGFIVGAWGGAASTPGGNEKRIESYGTLIEPLGVSRVRRRLSSTAMVR